VAAATAVLLGSWLALPYLNSIPGQPGPRLAASHRSAPTPRPTPKPSPSRPKPSPSRRRRPNGNSLHPSPTPSPTPAAPATPASNLTEVPGSGVAPGAKVIGLTFDDGPDPTYTPQVLAVLQQFQVTATFFMIGWEVAARPDLVRQVAADGEGIGNHTWNHVDLTTLNPAAWPIQVDQTTALLDSLTGRHVTCLRPPGGHLNPQVDAMLGTRGLTPVVWDDDPRDWTRPGTAAIVRGVLAEARPGAIVEMHDGGGNRSETVQALPAIITGLRAQGYSFAPICR